MAKYHRTIFDLLLPFSAVWLLLDHATSCAVEAFAVKAKQKSIW